MGTRVGISGWTYPPWRGTFYPAGLPHRCELAYAAQRLDSIEINGTFYALQKPDSFRHWRDETPRNFLFSVKAPRFITHMKKLRDVDGALANFFASGLLVLGPKLGPVLWQLPPNLGYDRQRIESFVAALPVTTGEAAYLARRHDQRLTGRAWSRTEQDVRMRHALEVRHSSFENCPEFLDILTAHDVALVIADTAGRFPAFTQLTASFAYARLHGADELYVSGYTDAGLDRWARTVRGWPVADSYVYFDNDAKVRSPVDAMNLARRLSP